MGINQEEFQHLQRTIPTLPKGKLRDLCLWLLDENQRLQRVIAGSEEGDLQERINQFLHQTLPPLPPKQKETR